MARLERSPNMVRVLGEMNRRVGILEQAAGQSKTVTYQPDNVSSIGTASKSIMTVDVLAGQDAILECYIKATGALTRTSGSANMNIQCKIDGTAVFPSSLSGAVLSWNTAGTTTLRIQQGTVFGTSNRPGGFVVLEQDSGVVLDPGLRTVEFTTNLDATGSTGSLSNIIISLRCS